MKKILIVTLGPDKKLWQVQLAFCGPLEFKTSADITRLMQHLGQKEKLLQIYNGES